jgi:hypothetical protein
MPKAHPPILVALLLIAAFAGAGCGGPATGRPPRAYWGTTLPMTDVVQRINQNNQEIPTLWASHGYKATVVDDKGKTHTFTGDGALLYRGPREMRLIGNKEFVGTVFEVGSTNDRFWLKLVPEVDTMWWGNYQNLGKPCAQAIPLRPDLVVEVLGIGVFNTNLTTLPAPTMRFNHERDAYMFVWNAPLPDRWVAIKEVWYDRATLRPTLVMLYDADGRVVVRAELRNHRPVEVKDLPRDRWPVVAGEYRLFFPDNGTTMELDLREIMLNKRGSPPRGLTFPDPRRAGVDRVVQIDEACEGER